MIDLTPGQRSQGLGVNDRRQVVGVRFTGSGLRAFRWTRQDGMKDLGTLGGNSSVAQAVNDVGEVVGYSATPPSGEEHAFLWTPQNGMMDLGTLGGPTSFAFAISNDGMVVGASVVASGALHAFRWRLGRGMTDLGTLSAGFSTAFGVNELGEVVGESGLRAFRWTERDGMVDLGVLSSGRARDISNPGTIVGSITTTSGNNRAVLLTSGPPR